MEFLISSQNSVYFVNTSLFLFVETTVKYLFPFIFSMHPSTPSTKDLPC